MYAICKKRNIFDNRNLYLDSISLKCLAKGLIGKKSELVQEMVCRLLGAKALPEQYW